MNKITVRAIMGDAASNHAVHLLDPNIFRSKYLMSLPDRKKYFEKTNNIGN